MCTNNDSHRELHTEAGPVTSDITLMSWNQSVGFNDDKNDMRIFRYTSYYSGREKPKKTNSDRGKGKTNKKAGRAIARKPRDAVSFDLMFADMYYKFKSSQAPKARLQSCRYGEKSRI